MDRIKAYFNDSDQGHEMSVRRMRAIMEVWRRDGRDVKACADEGPRLPLGVGLTRMRVTITPPGPKRHADRRTDWQARLPRVT